MYKLSSLAVILLLTGCARHGSLQKEQELQSLLDKKEYFKLKAGLQAAQDDISDEKRLYFQAFTNNAFNRNRQSIQDVDSLLTQYNSNMPDSVKAGLLEIQSDNYFKTFQYAKTAQTDSDLLNHYSKVLDSTKIKDLKNDLLMHNALHDIPPQEVFIHANTNIGWERDKLGIMEIPVRYKDSIYSCVFDTRANISSISKTYATKLGLKMLDVSYDEGSGITGITFKTGLGIADSLYIGDILIRHAIFQVMPDEILHFEQVQFSINVIIGYPIIEQLKEIHIYKDGKMMIPDKPAKSNLSNLAMDKLNPVIFAKKDNDTLCFNFDSGAGSSDFYSTYYEKYKDKILQEGKKTTVQTGGAGGALNIDVYILDSLNLDIANKQVTLKKVVVHIHPITGNTDEKFYGNLGQDLIMQFDEMILNFEDMYIEFR